MPTEERYPTKRLDTSSESAEFLKEFYPYMLKSYSTGRNVGAVEEE